ILKTVVNGARGAKLCFEYLSPLRKYSVISVVRKAEYRCRAGQSGACMDGTGAEGSLISRRALRRGHPISGAVVLLGRVRREDVCLFVRRRGDRAILPRRHRGTADPVARSTSASAPG
uniref:hypothetical protein n=1 Tax=Methylobacterium sp. B34 TaxID=95563 RepID=UPI00195537ED